MNIDPNPGDLVKVTARNDASLRINPVPIGMTQHCGFVLNGEIVLYIARITVDFKLGDLVTLHFVITQSGQLGWMKSETGRVLQVISQS